MLEILSRWQFAFTVGFHYLFVPVTIGLIVPVAILETFYFRTKKGMYKSLSNFWSDIFVVNYVVGIATGLTMAIQFGTNWSRYSIFMGDVFGSPLAFEALLAFFLESTFAGIWIFKRNTITPALRLLTIWLIVLGTSISAIWILTANSFMQHPVGYKLLEDGSKVVLTSFKEVLFNPYVFWMFIHNHAAALLLGSFVMLGVSAYHLKQGHMVKEFKKSVSLALIIGIVTAVSLPILGDMYGRYIAEVQPLKAAAILNRLPETPPMGEIPPPDTASSASLKGLDTQRGVPNQALVHTSYMIMVGLGGLFILILLLFLFKRKLILKNRFFQNLAMFLIPAGYIAILCGWVVTETGRLPWLVYGLMTVEEGISSLPIPSVAFSLFLILVLYTVLFLIDVHLIWKIVRKGPEQYTEEEQYAAS